MPLPKVTVGVVLFGTKYLAESLPSLIAQNYEKTEFILRDQSPGGEAYDYIQNELHGIAGDPRVKLERGGNLWHSGGHNALIRQALLGKADFYLCASNDMLYESNLVTELIRGLREFPEQPLGAVTGKLLRWDYAALEKGAEIAASKTGIIDSFGLGLTRSHKFFELGGGQPDTEKPITPFEIFGASGALALYNLRALEDVAYARPDGQKEYFEELLHYKNDVDLAYRLRLAGYRSYLIPSAVAYHDRQTKAQGFFADRRLKPRWVKESSFFGQKVVLSKNFSGRKFSFSVKILTFFRSFIQDLFALFCEPFLLKQFNKLRAVRVELNQKKAALKVAATPSEIEIFMQSPNSSSQ